METGRLIEAETLKASVRAKFPNVADRCEINELINAAPTIDAIPVEWLLKKREQLRKEQYGRLDAVAITKVLWYWADEQEASADEAQGD